MSVTKIEGIVKNGHIVLPEGASLPELARVYVIVQDPKDRKFVRSPRLIRKEDAKMFEKVVEVVPDDEV